MLPISGSAMFLINLRTIGAWPVRFICRRGGTLEGWLSDLAVTWFPNPRIDLPPTHLAPQFAASEPNSWFSTSRHFLRWVYRLVGLFASYRRDIGLLLLLSERSISPSILLSHFFARRFKPIRIDRVICHHLRSQIFHIARTFERQIDR